MKKVLIVGLGSIGKKHLNAANELKCKVDVISKHAKISENFQLVDNLKNKRVYDLGIICSNTSNHLNDLLRTSKYCKTILVEKPLNHIYIPTQLKIKLEKLKPLVVLGFNLRYLDLMIFLKTYLTDKKIISVENIFWDDCRKWYEGRDFKKLYVSNKHLGGGALLTNIHELDYIKFICNADINHINITYQKNKDNLDKSCMVKGMLDREISFKSSLNIFSSFRIRKGIIRTNDESIEWDIDQGIINSNLEGVIFNKKTNYLKTYTSQLKHLFEKNHQNISTIQSNIKLNNLIFNQ